MRPQLYNSKGEVDPALWLCGLALSTAARAQPLSVYSEFAQINAAGDVTAPETPREILSPALVRNGFTSFQVVVEAPVDAKWRLFVGQNPEKTVKVTVYRESGDMLEPIDLPHPGMGTEVFWMDLWTPAETPPQRIKVEPELNIDDDWVAYPIEAQVMDAKVPDAAKSVVSYLCPLEMSAAGPPVARLQLRNAAQDGALAGSRRVSSRS